MLNPLSIISKIFKSSNDIELAKFRKILEKINLLENDVAKIKDGDFPNKTNELKNQIKNGKNLDEVLPEAFAYVREASHRSRNERHFDVQLLGGIALHLGKIAEMRTGEGKTITIALAAYLNALSGKGVHIVTVNDYLAKRDCENMSKIYNFLGLSAGYVNNDQSDDERRKNYLKDITYATNSELGFDYLKDNMKYSSNKLVQREHSFAIVDEIDSCLIDEARTPLVISGQSDETSNQYKAINKLVTKLKPNDYELDEKDKNVTLTNEGIDSIEK